MKAKITDEIKEIFSQGVNWAKLEIEYVKLTAAEKLIILMTPPLAYLSVGGIVLILLALVYLLRNQLVINPVAKFVSRLFLDKRTKNNS